MKMFHSILLLASLGFASQLLANGGINKVIYGEDNRVDVYASQNSAYVELAKSTAAMIKPSSLIADANDMVKISGPSLAARGMCKSERFSSQSTVANCSGFLVSENLLVTAGHCITDESACKEYKWVFDYKVDSEEQASVTVNKSNIYSCKRIISRSLDQMNKDDYALIELDRSVSDRRPLEFRKSGKINVGENILVIGHPTGLPTKIADGAKVRSLKGKFFHANLDTYGGNSGSAVFNAQTGLIEGILVRGENDYVYDSNQGCKVSNLCPENGCRGEDVTFITNIPELRNLK
jgi:V8-like Glu-specific endopeptidase